MGKCCLLQSDVEALGDLADGIMTQVWWAPTNPYSSALTGISSESLNEAYMADHDGRVMPQPAAYAYEALELAIQTFNTTKSLEKEDIRTALSSLDVDTIIGHVKYDQKMKGLSGDELRDAVELLYDQALIAEGSSIPDPGRFSKLLTALMLKP
jgi:branched-chain amino acid transport system substrate-binding protein